MECVVFNFHTFLNFDYFSYHDSEIYKFFYIYLFIMEVLKYRPPPPNRRTRSVIEPTTLFRKNIVQFATPSPINNRSIQVSRSLFNRPTLKLAIPIDSTIDFNPFFNSLPFAQFGIGFFG